jgi:hypothetical protein
MDPQNIIQLKQILNNTSSIDIFIPYVICIIFITITTYYIIRINLTLSKIDWAKNKCVPKYMFVSGFIQKEPGLNILGSISKNFKQCIKDGLKIEKSNATPSELDKRREKRIINQLKKQNKKQNN